MNTSDSNKPGQTHPPGDATGRRGRRPKAPRTTADCIREYGRTIVLLKTGEMEPRRANALVLALNGLIGALNGVELEERLAALENGGVPDEASQLDA